MDLEEAFNMIEGNPRYSKYLTIDSEDDNKVYYKVKPRPGLFQFTNYGTLGSCSDIDDCLDFSSALNSITLGPNKSGAVDVELTQIGDWNEGAPWSPPITASSSEKYINNKPRFALLKKIDYEIKWTYLIEWGGCWKQGSLQKQERIISYDNYVCEDGLDYLPGTMSCGTAFPINYTIEVYKGQCHYPFAFDKTDNQCVTYCPSHEPLDLDYAICRPDRGQLNEPNCAEKVLNPIMASNGEKTQTFTADFKMAGAFPLQFTRTYASLQAPEIKQNYGHHHGTSSWDRREYLVDC